MPRKSLPAVWVARAHLENARGAENNLKAAERAASGSCPRLAARIRGTLKSAQGAVRHAERILRDAEDEANREATHDLAGARGEEEIDTMANWDLSSLDVDNPQEG